MRLPLSLTLSLFLSLSHTHTHSHTLSLSLSLSLFLYLTHTHTQTLSLSPSLSHDQDEATHYIMRNIVIRTAMWEILSLGICFLACRSSLRSPIRNQIRTRQCKVVSYSASGISCGICYLSLDIASTRYSTTLPQSKVNLPHAIDFRALCSAKLVTLRSKYLRNETGVLHRVERKTHNTTPRQRPEV